MTDHSKVKQSFMSFSLEWQTHLRLWLSIGACICSTCVFCHNPWGPADFVLWLISSDTFFFPHFFNLLFSPCFQVIEAFPSLISKSLTLKSIFLNQFSISYSSLFSREFYSCWLKFFISLLTSSLIQGYSHTAAIISLILSS